MIEDYKNIFAGITLNQLALLIIFSVLYLWRLLYLFLFTGKILFIKKANIANPEIKPLSLLLTIRNEEENLKNNLPKILSLNNADFEMVVVDDFSQDNSYLILGLLKKRYKRLKISVLNQEIINSLKLSQNIAIKAAGNEWILNIPISLCEFTNKWLNEFSKIEDSEKNVVIGYSTLTNSKGFYNRLFRIENYFLYIRSTGYILNNLPFVYSEENISFRKEKYFEIGGYAQKVNEQYANLELIINSFIRKKTTTVLFNNNCNIRKKENIEQADYFDLLKKSIRIEKHLSILKRSVLFLDELARLLLLPIAIFVIVLFSELWVIFTILLGFMFLTRLVIIKITQNRLNEHKIFIPSLVYEFIMPYFKLFFRWHFNWRSKRNRWKSKI